VVRADRELVLGEDHPLGDLPAQLRPLEPRAVGHHRPRARHRDRLAGRDVRGAADDVGDIVLTDRDRADPQAIGIRVRLGGEHATDHEVLELGDAVRVDPVDLRAGHREARGEGRTSSPGSQ
jgi:hypothetical protein